MLDGGSVLSDKASFEALSGKGAALFRPDVMFDRVVNVKLNYKRFTKVNGATQYIDSFPLSAIIRSDYEIVGNKIVDMPNQVLKTVNDVVGGSPSVFHFEKVKVKPDIRVEYHGIGNVGLNFTVTIGNFYTLVGDIAAAMELNSNGNVSYTTKIGGQDTPIGIKITSIEVLFGYMPQFPDLTMYPPNTAFAYYNNFDGYWYSNASYIKGNVLYWYRSELPPDGAYTFQCAVASVEMPVASYLARISTSLDEVTPAIQNDLSNYMHANNGSFVALLDWYITKHYVRFDEEASDPSFMELGLYRLSEKGASLAGVQVFINSALALTKMLSVNYTVLLPFAKTVLGMLDNIKNAFYPTMDYKMGLDGNVYIYDTRENVDDPEIQSIIALNESRLDAYNAMVASRRFTEGRKDYRPWRTATPLPVVIPAVYDVRYGPITEIVCPLFGTLFPGQKVVFNTRYSVAESKVAAIATAVPNGETTYKVIYYDLDFGTTAEYNNMKLYCTRVKTNI